MKKMRKKTILALAAVFAAMLWMNRPVYAAEGDPTMVMGTTVLSQNMNEDEGRQIVAFASEKDWRKWYVISYDGTGNKEIAKDGKGVITLFQAFVNDDWTSFNDENRNSNIYKGSLLEQYHDKMVNGGKERILTEAEKEAVSVRTLEGGNSAYLWPLSVEELAEMPYSLRTDARSPYWTRSPEAPGQVYIIGYPNANIGSVINVANDWGNTGYLGVRPAVNLKLSSILFTSALDQGKQCKNPGADGLEPVTNEAGDLWKLTVKDSTRNNFKTETTAITDGIYDISYSGALTGENEFISAVIVGSKGKIKYYGNIKKLPNKADASGTFSINTTGKMESGDVLYVFNEQIHSGGSTDYSSELIEVTPPKIKVLPSKKKTTSASGGVLLARMDKKGKNGVKITWTKLSQAKGYDIFFAHSDTDEEFFTYKKVKTIKGNKKFTWKKAGLKKYHCYKAYVRAWVKKNGKKKYIKSSPTVHVFITGPKGRFTNPKRVYVTKTVITLKKGKSKNMKARVAKPRKGLKYLSRSHAPKLRYVSANPKIASVSSTGKITAKGAGKCKVYALAVNGARKSVIVKVK